MTFRELAQQLYGEWKFIMATPNEPTQIPREQIDPLVVQRIADEIAQAQQNRNQATQNAFDLYVRNMMTTTPTPYDEVRIPRTEAETQNNPITMPNTIWAAPDTTEWNVDPSVGVIPGPNDQPLRWVRPDEWYRDPVRPNPPQELNPVDEGRKMDRAMTVAPPFSEDEKVNLVQYNLLQILRRVGTVRGELDYVCPRCKNGHILIGKYSNDWVVGKCSNAGCLSFYGYMKDLA